MIRADEDKNGFITKITCFGKPTNTSNDYAIMLGNGPDRGFWNDCSRLYQVLRNEKGFKKDHISIAFASGKKGNKEMNMRDYTVSEYNNLPSSTKNSSEYTFVNVWKKTIDGETYEYSSSVTGSTKYYRQKCAFPFDLDRDNVDEKICASKKSSIDSVFTAVQKKITTNDNLVILIAGHGNYDLVALNEYIDYSNFLKTQLQKIKAKHIYIMSTSCHSGSLITFLKADNRTIISESAAVESGSFYNGGNTSQNYISVALAGYGQQDHWGGNNLVKLPTDSIDFDRDGNITYEEAFVYAKEHDPASNVLDVMDPVADTLTERPWKHIRFWSSKFKSCRYDIHGVVNQKKAISNKNETVESMYILNASNKITNSKSTPINVKYRSGKIIRLQKGFKIGKGVKFSTEKIICATELTPEEDPYNELRFRRILQDDTEVISENEEANPSDILLYPNPTEGVFSIHFGGEEGQKSVTIMDVSGKLVYSNNFDTDEAEIDLSGNAQGIYFVRITSNGASDIKRVILK